MSQVSPISSDLQLLLDSAEASIMSVSNYNPITSVTVTPTIVPSPQNGNAAVCSVTLSTGFGVAVTEIGASENFNNSIDDTLQKATSLAKCRAAHTLNIIASPFTRTQPTESPQQKTITVKNDLTLPFGDAKTVRIAKLLQEKGSEGCTRKELETWTNWSETTVRDRLNELIAHNGAISKGKSVATCYFADGFLAK